MQIPMRELERKTGFSRATILFYIKEGLLPEPQKTARNMAYYDYRFVARLKLIRELKDRHNYSLSQIKELIHETPLDLSVAGLLLDVRDSIFHQIVKLDTDPPVTWAQLEEETGLDEGTLNYLRDSKMIYPLAKSEKNGDDDQPLYHVNNVIIGQLIKLMIEMGVPLGVMSNEGMDIPRIWDGIQHMAQTEIDAFKKYVSEPGVAANTDPDEVWLNTKTGLELTHSLMALLHLNTLYRLIGETPWPPEIKKQAQEYSNSMPDEMDL
jgi:DNA-binding transcriptional MerR regulator